MFYDANGYHEAPYSFLCDLITLDVFTPLFLHEHIQSTTSIVLTLHLVHASNLSVFFLSCHGDKRFSFMRVGFCKTDELIV